MLSMDAGPIIFDISSDEEEEVQDQWDKLDWISKLLDDPDEESSDPDAVVALDDLSCDAAVASKPNIWAPTAKKDSGDSSDDDCMILEGDPDKPIAVVHDKEHESDDLLIVGEKGDLACRDYPHPRHLCAQFPFRSTPHNLHCNQCHCYVCDVVAPCAHWGNGSSITDHCEATDKEERWKILRKSLKDGTALIVDGKNPINTAATLQSHMMSNATRVYHPMLPAPRPAGAGVLRACSNSSFRSPNLISRSRVQQSVDGRVLYQFHQLVSTPNAVRARQGVGVQPGSPALTNSRVPCPRPPFVRTPSVSRTGNVAAPTNRFHRPVYRPHQMIEPRSRYVPAQGPWRSQHPTNLESRKHQNAAIQDSSGCQAEPVFKRLRIEHLPDSSVQQNQFPSEIQLDAVEMKRLNDIMSGLESEIGVSSFNHIDNPSTAFEPLSIPHPPVPVVSVQDVETPGGSDDHIPPIQYEAYNPSFPGIGYNPGGSNLWSSSPAMTDMSSSGYGLGTAGYQPQNYVQQFLTESLTVNDEAPHLPSMSNDPRLSIADSYL